MSDRALTLMLDDLHNAPAIFQPTNYWHNYMQPILDEVQSFDVSTFRRERGSLMDSFGALDLAPDWVTLAQHRKLNNRVTRAIPGFLRLLVSLDRMVNRTVLSRALRVRAPYGLTLADLRATAYELTAWAGKQSRYAKPLSQLSVSRVGDPEDAWEVDGRTITMSALHYYLRYAYVAQFIDLDAIWCVAELGSGVGKQAEVLHALHPHLTLALFDMPPQLYVAEQFLDAACPGAVYPYTGGRLIDRLDRVGPGAIAMFGNMRIDLVREGVDLFWNAASFQEMEPAPVAHYLQAVRSGSARAVYIQAMMQGQTRARAEGAHGVLEPVTFAHYTAGLDGFRLVNRSPSRTPFGSAAGLEPGYEDALWVR